ncbi:MAG: hypothetical protein KGJ07_09760 [Patescibacteria group bacterium]|nr:hypothetical protein [Patescibacteria group bacterium]
MFKKYLFTIQIRDGENKYFQHSICEAPSLEKAKELKDKVTQSWLSTNDYRIAEVIDVAQITKGEAEVFQELEIANFLKI